MDHHATITPPPITHYHVQPFIPIRQTYSDSLISDQEQIMYRNESPMMHGNPHV